MKEVSHLLRESYLTLLQPLIVEATVIPIFDERVNPKATIPTYRSADEAYVLITDQSETENTTNRNNLSKDCTISLEITTKFKLNYGGQLACSLISNEIQQAVRILLQNPIAIPGFQVMLTRVPVNRNLPAENGTTQTVYRKLLVFNHKIIEL